MPRRLSRSLLYHGTLRHRTGIALLPAWLLRARFAPAAWRLFPVMQRVCLARGRLPMSPPWFIFLTSSPCTSLTGIGLHDFFHVYLVAWAGLFEVWHACTASSYAW